MKIIVVLSFFVAGIAFANPNIDKRLDEAAKDKNKWICIEYIEFNPTTKERKIISKACVKKPKVKQPSKKDRESIKRI